MLQAGVLALVHEATPWINSFVLVESKDKLGNLKLCICLDPTNLNKEITREPYHFRMPEDIEHLLADACIMRVCDCKKGYWHQKLDQASSFLTTFNTEIGRFRYTVMPFGITVHNQQENATSGLTLTSCNTRRLKSSSLERHTLLMAASQLKARSLP